MPIDEQLFCRTATLLGGAAMERLARGRVVVFGAGGVGGHAIEAIARCGVGSLHVVDNDTVSPSNINRQLLALHSTIGRYKADVAVERIGDINPQCEAKATHLFYLPENADAFDLSGYDYVVDCIDTVAAKVELAVRCQALGVPIISCMGAGGKLRPELFRVADIYATEMDPLARVMRGKLRQAGVRRLKVVYSPEKPVVVARPPASIAFVPAAAGLVVAGEVIRDLCVSVQ